LIAFAVAAAVLAYVWPRSPEPSDLPETAPLTASNLGFKVNRAGSDFEVSWDRSSSAVQRASSGTFTVRDGGFTKTVPLSPAQLREARIVYSPLLGDLDFRLEIATSDHRTQAESVQVLGWTSNPAPPANALPTPVPALAPPVRPSTAVPLGKSVQPGLNQPGSAPPVAPMKVISPAVTARTPAAVASPPAASKAPTSLPTATKPAQIAAPPRPGDAVKAPSGVGVQKSSPTDGKAKTQAPSASK